MLTITLITAIGVVALPNIRISSLAILRTVAISLVISIFTLTPTFSFNMDNNIVNIFNGLVVFDSISIFTNYFLFIFGAIAISFWTINISGKETPISISLLILFSLIGSIFIVSSNDIITLILAVELQSFAVYAITASYRSREGSTHAGILYFLLGGLSSAIILLGIMIIFSITGLTSFNDIHSIISGGSNDIVLIGAIIMMIGFLFKIASAPFHYWAPDVYDRVPTGITIWISIIPKIAIIGFILRIRINYIDIPSWVSLLLISAIISLIIGSIVGLSQIRIKRLLAYSTISHVGFILIAISCGNFIGIFSFWFYLGNIHLQDY